MNVDEILDITKGNKKVDEVLSSLDDIKSEMKVLEADLKGIKVNEEV